jgi:hypothetical protein
MDMCGNTTCNDKSEGFWLFCTAPPEEIIGGLAGAVREEEERYVLQTSHLTQSPAKQSYPTRSAFADRQFSTFTKTLCSSWAQVDNLHPMSLSVGVLGIIQAEPESETSAATSDPNIGMSDRQGFCNFHVDSTVQEHHGPNISMGSRSGRALHPSSDIISLKGGSLTSSTEPFKGGSASERTHLTSGAMSKPHPTSSASSNASPSTVTLRQTPPRVSSLLGQLTGYSSSEDDDLDPFPEKSGHLLRSDGDSESRDLHYQPRNNQPSTTRALQGRLPTASAGYSTATWRQASISLPSKSLHRQVARQSPSKPTSSTEGSHDLLSGCSKMAQPHSSNKKKRPTSPNAPTMQAKRPKILGGFIDNESEDDSDDETEVNTQSQSQGEAEAKAYDHEVDPNQDEDDWDQIPAMPPPPTRMPLDNLKLAPSSAPLPAKGVNMNRLKMLLSKKGERSTFGRGALPNRLEGAAAAKSTEASKRMPTVSRLDPNPPTKFASSQKTATVLRQNSAKKAVPADQNMSSASRKPCATPQVGSTQAHPHVLIPSAPSNAAAGRAGAASGGVQNNIKPKLSQASSSNAAKSSLPIQAGSHMAASLPLSSNSFGHSGKIAGAPSKTERSSQANALHTTNSGSPQMRQKNLTNPAIDDAVKGATGTSTSTAGVRQTAVRKEKSQNAAGSSAGSGLVGGLLRNIREDDPPTVNAPKRVHPTRSFAFKKSGSDGQPPDNILGATASLEKKTSQQQLVKQPAIAPSDLPSFTEGRPGGASSLSFSRTNPQNPIPRSTIRGPDAQTQVKNEVATDKSKDSQSHQKRKAEAISGKITENTVPTKKPAIGEDSFPAAQPVLEQHGLSAVNAGSKKSPSVPLSTPLSGTEKAQAKRRPTVNPSSPSQSVAPNSTTRQGASQVIPSPAAKHPSDRPATRELGLKDEGFVRGSNSFSIPAQDASPATTHRQFPEESSSAPQTAPEATPTSKAVLKTPIMTPSARTAETLVKTQKSPPEGPASRANSEDMNEVAKEKDAAAKLVSAEQIQASAQIPTVSKALGNDMQQESVSGKLPKESVSAATKVPLIGDEQTERQGRSDTHPKTSKASTITSSTSPTSTITLQRLLTTKSKSVKLPPTSKPALITPSMNSTSSTTVSPASSPRVTDTVSLRSSGRELKTPDLGVVHKQAQVETSRSIRKDEEAAESATDGFADTLKNVAQPEDLITQPATATVTPTKAPLVKARLQALKPVVTAPKKPVIDKGKQQDQPKDLIEKEQPSLPTPANTSLLKEGPKAPELIGEPLKLVAKPPTALPIPSKPIARPPQPIATSPRTTVDERKGQLQTPEKEQAEVILLSTSPKPSKDAEPYFEYSVFQKTWSHTQTEHKVATTEIIARPFTCIDDANFQAETLFNTAWAQYQQHFQVRFSEFSTSRDEHDCAVHVGVFAPVDYPGRKSRLKIWVKRDFVSALADRTSGSLELTPFVSKTVYILRLFRILDQAPEGDDDDRDTVMADNDASTIRVYLPIPCAEAYTSLGAANLAARNLQIELGHEKNPRGFQATWQVSDLASLNEKMSVLAEGVDVEKGDGCWRSTFNGAGKGGDKLELLVEKVGLCGPRNL